MQGMCCQRRLGRAVSATPRAWEGIAGICVSTLLSLMQEGVLPGMVEARYASYAQGVGKQIRACKVRPGQLRVPIRFAAASVRGVAAPEMLALGVSIQTIPNLARSDVCSA